MGVDYTYLLIPRDNTYRPDPEAVRRLVEAWRDNGFAVRPGSPQHRSMNFRGSTTSLAAAATGVSVQTAHGCRSFRDADFPTIGEGELILQWPVTNNLDGDLKNPLGLTDDEDGTYFDLELHFSDDFVSQTNELIYPIDATCAECDADLEYSPEHEEDIFYSSRVRYACPDCAAPFRPQDHAVIVRDGKTGEETDVDGGATYRFAIVIDCGKSWRTETPAKASPVVTDEFLSLCSEALGCELYGVGYFD
jgi:hypothetical protein